MRKTLVLLFLTCLSCTYLPLPYKDLLSGVEVREYRDYIEISPSSGSVHPVGLMFWPGGLVDPHVYVPSLAPFSARGFKVVIGKVPFNLAITDLGKGLHLAQYLGGDWVAGGHSLGGTAAAWTVHDHPSAFQGLALMASYPTDEQSLRSWDGRVLSLSAQNDGLATPQEIIRKKDLLPPVGTGPGSTTYVLIPGGNHAQFGYYGPQDGDGKPSISPQDQWNQMADALELFWSTL